jgi:hypothetical protein
MPKSTAPEEGASEEAEDEVEVDGVSSARIERGNAKRLRVRRVERKQARYFFMFDSPIDL